MVHPLLNGYIASLCCSVANTPPTIWTNLKFQQYTALAGPSWAFIHSAHFIELIEKHRDSFPWLGPFNPQDLTSNIRYHVPDLIFPAAALTELTASEHLCPCLSERRGGCGASFVRIVTGVTELQLLQKRATESQWQPQPGSVTVWQLCKKPTA